MGNIAIHTIPVVTLNSINTLKTVTNEAVKWKEVYLLEYVCCKCVFYFRHKCIASMTWTASFLESFNSVIDCKDRNVKGTRTFAERSSTFPKILPWRVLLPLSEVNFTRLLWLLPFHLSAWLMPLWVFLWVFASFFTEFKIRWLFRYFIKKRSSCIYCSSFLCSYWL